SSAPAEDVLPDSVSIQARTVVLQQRRIEDVSLSMAHPSPGVWRAQIDSPRVAGSLEWLPDRTTAGGEGRSRVVVRLSRLKVPEADAQVFAQNATERLLDTSARPLPALDIVVEQFEWGGVPLGRIEVDALNRLVPAGNG